MQRVQLAIVLMFLSAAPAWGSLVEYYAQVLMYREGSTAPVDGSSGQFIYSDNGTPVSGTSATSHTTQYLPNVRLEGSSSITDLTTWKAASLVSGDVTRVGSGLKFTTTSLAVLYDEIQIASIPGVWQGYGTFELDWQLSGNTSISYQIPVQTDPFASVTIEAGLKIRCSSAPVGSAGSLCSADEAAPYRGVVDGSQTTLYLPFDGPTNRTLRVRYSIFSDTRYNYQFNPTLFTSWTLNTSQDAAYSARIAADFSHTATLTSAKLFDGSGTEIQNFQVTSASGLNYANLGAPTAAPEPGTYFQAGGAALLLAIGARIRRIYKSPTESQIST